MFCFVSYFYAYVFLFFCGIVARGYLIIFGGYRNEEESKEIWKCNYWNGLCSKCSVELPEKRWGSGVKKKKNDMVHIIGGNKDGEPQRTHWIISLDDIMR